MCDKAFPYLIKDTQITGLGTPKAVQEENSPTQMEEDTQNSTGLEWIATSPTPIHKVTIYTIRSVREIKLMNLHKETPIKDHMDFQTRLTKKKIPKQDKSATTTTTQSR